MSVIAWSCYPAPYRVWTSHFLSLLLLPTKQGPSLPEASIMKRKANATVCFPKQSDLAYIPGLANRRMAFRYLQVSPFLKHCFFHRIWCYHKYQTRDSFHDSSAVKCSLQISRWVSEKEVGAVEPPGTSYSLNYSVVPPMGILYGSGSNDTD